MAKQRNKNKESLNSKSGVKKKTIINKTVVKFEFEDLLGKKYVNGGLGRIKLSLEGYVTLVIKEEGKWKNVSGKLISLKITQVPKINKINGKRVVSSRKML